ncbi:MAG: hypothetical protein CMJ25_11710 [Phycisphaerae bacterium]|nr:hypothetical protein [Phycisphaerae bacterium]|tara:strand:- start:215 stop:433 length:219 start_codon:yes stop_codon:yes gene_type:complete
MLHFIDREQTPVVLTLPLKQVVELSKCLKHFDEQIDSIEGIEFNKFTIALLQMEIDPIVDQCNKLMKREDQC